MQEKNEETALLVLIAIIILGAPIIYLNKNVSLLEFRLLFFLFYVPVFIEFLLFRNRFHSKMLRNTLFIHASSFLVITIGLYIRESEKLFFGLFFAGFLVIVLSYILLESFSTTNFIMKLFTASIAFWIVYSYFPLSRFLSVVFGTVAFFLSYIFFDIPGKVRQPPPVKPATEQEIPLQSLKSVDTTPPTAEKVFAKREFMQIAKELDHLIRAVTHAPYTEYFHLKEEFEHIQSLYEKKADSFRRCIPLPDLKKFQNQMNQCSTLLLTMQTVQNEWNTLRKELNHLKDHVKEVTPLQVTNSFDQFLSLWEQSHAMIPASEEITFRREITAVADAVLKYEKIKREWNQLTQDVNDLMSRIQIADIAECNTVKDRFNLLVTPVQRCIPRERIEEIHQKIMYCESRITLLQEWDTLTRRVDNMVKGVEACSREKVLTLEREFLSKIDEFESVVSPREISWMKVTFKLCRSRLEHEGTK